MGGAPGVERRVERRVERWWSAGGGGAELSPLGLCPFSPGGLTQN